MTRRYSITFRKGQALFWTPVTPPSEIVPRFLKRCRDSGFPIDDESSVTLLNANTTCFPPPFDTNPAASECLKMGETTIAWDSEGKVLDPDEQAAQQPKDGWIDAKKSPAPLHQDVLVQLADGSVVIGLCDTTTLQSLRWVDEKGMTLEGTQEVLLWQPIPKARKF